MSFEGSFFVCMADYDGGLDVRKLLTILSESESVGHEMYLGNTKRDLKRMIRSISGNNYKRHLFFFGKEKGYRDS